ncbi:hypothetical protein B0H63DRAFT_448814 [Podospora didyma]|uniref:6-phosphogluconate dehydrogenase NADP-binding domain-containing protein n=1 Tax=Podospora didyma TaxID=330526 RepID=A0AAE0NUP0_9PEZI|nr:hypothetical protein B0H63DRAFT_448814 [Podospora didyma]
MFFVGSGIFDVLKKGTGPLYPADLFNYGELPLFCTVEFPPVPRVQHESSGASYTPNSPGHLYGHANLLARIGERKYVYLEGNCCHNPRILRGEKGIALYEDGRGGLRSVHVDTGMARNTLDQIAGFASDRKLGFEDVERSRNTFDESADTVAFIGLGVMGYPMAKNLRAGLGPEKVLLICDVNHEAITRFKIETEG